MRKKVEAPVTPKKIGRPKGATNKVVKEEVEKVPKNLTSMTLKAVQIYGDRVILEGEEKVTMSPLDFSSAVLNHGYSTKDGFTIKVAVNNGVARYYGKR